MVKKVLLLCVKLGFAAGLFALLFYPQLFGLPADKFQRVSPGDMLEELRQAGASNLVFWLVAAVVVRVTGMLCGVLRWRILLRGQGLHMPFWYMVGSWFIGRTFGIFLPGTIGLDGYRLYDSSMYTGEVIKCTTVIAIEKLIGFIALTFLVFVTFPLGFKILDFSLPTLAITLLILGAFVGVSFVTLLNPRVIQVLVMALPTPTAVRAKVNKLGASITAYSGKRSDLLLAVFYGFIVHAATALMYFCTMMAIRTPNTNIFDVLFASPLVIYSTVLAPTVGGLGAREIVGVALLGGQSGAAAALTFFHLGWWVGDVTPYLIGLPILAFRSRPSAAQVQAKLAELRGSAGVEPELIHLSPEEISRYRDKLLTYLLSGAAAGLIAGALTGIVEAGWLVGRAGDLKEGIAFWWGPAVYGLCFVGVGLGVAGVGLFLSLLRDRFWSAKTLFGLSLGGALAAAALVIGRFRFKQDVLGEMPLTTAQNLTVMLIAAGIALAGLVVGWIALSVVRGNRKTGAIAAVAAYLAIVIIGVVLSTTRVSAAKEIDFTPVSGLSAPNIVLIAVDTLRADYLKVYDPEAKANTPAIDALRADSILYDKCFAQSSWTKASFATIFSGRYPENHNAVSKGSVLPESVTTFPEMLKDHGYYTQGFCNNPNIAATYNYDQGFVEYAYLNPRYLFFAGQSAEKMTLYKTLRQVYNKLMGGRINVRDFYQPADTVTASGLSWLDSQSRPKDSPFFLFLHYMDPHDPYMDHDNPGTGYARVRLGDKIDPDKMKQTLQDAYIGEIEYCDRHIGALIEGLKQRGLYDDSVIVFTSDHGEEFHEHGGWWHGLSLYDEQIGVPLLIKLPGNQNAGETNSFMGRHVDLGPTLLQLARVEADKIADSGMQGQPLFAADDPSAFQDVAKGYAYSHLNFEGIELRALRTPSYKLIHSNENKRNYKPVELYNVELDPAEQNNLAGAGDPQEAALTQSMEQMRQHATENAAQPEAAVVDEQTQEQLNNLGYVGN